MSSVGSPSAGLGMFERVEHDRAGAEQVRLRDERVHPRAAALARRARRSRRRTGPSGAVLVEHVEDAHVGVIARQVVALGEAQRRRAVRRHGRRRRAARAPARSRAAAPRCRSRTGRGALVLPEAAGPRPRSGIRRPPTAAPPRLAAFAAAIGASLPSMASMASTDPAVAVSTTHDAWWGWPSSRARSARRATIWSSVARVSCSPPRPRLTDAVCSRSRSSRSVSVASAGCSVGSTSVRR